MWFNLCPKCSGYLVKISGTQKCLHCGYSDTPAAEHQENPYTEVSLLRNVEITAIAKKFLLQNKDGSFDYCQKRGITPDVIDAWELGYVPSGFPYFKDFWWKRILFPIRSNDGKSIIGFGGRTITAYTKDEGVPKYVNSCESDVYNKSESLYGYHLIPQGKRAYLCEGYVDVLSMYKHQYASVASLGTALTEQQSKLLRNKTESICLCFDADEGGQKAIIRAIPLLIHAGFKPENMSVFVIADAKDVDDVLQRGGSFKEITLMQYLQQNKLYSLYTDIAGGVV